MLTCRTCVMRSIALASVAKSSAGEIRELVSWVFGSGSLPAICRCLFFMCEVFFLGTARSTDSHISPSHEVRPDNVMTGIATDRATGFELHSF